MAAAKFPAKKPYLSKYSLLYIPYFTLRICSMMSL